MPIVPKWPVFFEYISPQAATFPVFLVFFFAFAASQDNHFPLKFMKASQTLSPKPTLLKQSIPPKNSPGEATGLLFCLLLVQMLPHALPQGRHLETPGTVLAVPLAHPLSPLAHPTGEQLDSCCPSWEGFGWEGDSSARPHITNISLFVEAQETCLDHYTQIFSSRAWAVLLKTRKPDCQVSPLWPTERRALPIPSSCCWGQVAPSSQKPEQEQALRSSHLPGAGAEAG